MVVNDSVAALISFPARHLRRARSWLYLARLAVPCSILRSSATISIGLPCGDAAAFNLPQSRRQTPLLLAMPGHVRVFNNQELDKAKRWISE